MVETSFYGIGILSEPGRVFTPRATTESLVARALELEPLTAADVGTGSGAIAIAIAAHAPNVEIWASDTCARAVALARENAGRHGVSQRVHVEHADLLGAAPAGLDLVLANLPYLPASLPLPEYAGEPPEAVYAPGDGLVHVRRLLAEAQRKLRPQGTLLVQLRGRLVEAGAGELTALRERLQSPAWAAS